MQTAMLTLRGRAARAHDEGDNRSVSAVFGSLPGSNFTINGAVPSKVLALVSAGADLPWLNNVTLSGMFEGQFSNTTTGYCGKGTVRYVWGRQHVVPTSSCMSQNESYLLPRT